MYISNVELQVLIDHAEAQCDSIKHVRHMLVVNIAVSNDPGVNADVSRSIRINDDFAKTLKSRLDELKEEKLRRANATDELMNPRRR